jgi:glutathione S-transferase
VITDGEVNISESGAIIEYIIRTYGQGKLTEPVDGSQGAIDDIYFHHYAEGSLMPVLVNKVIFTLVPKFSPWFIRWFVRMIFNGLLQMLVQPEVKKHVQMLESHLSKKEWFAGGSGPTRADFSMIMGMEMMVNDKVAGPEMVAYVKRIQAR